MLNSGEKLGQYQIIERLGSGGMADVYVAEDLNLNRRVALKVLPPEFTRDEQRVQRFEREVKAAALLNHPNIITVFDTGRQGPFYFYAMQLMRGGDLHQRIKVGLSTHDALKMMCLVANGIHHAHTKGFVHRDLKPENILFDTQGAPVITDFGIARAIESSEQLTATGKTLGTPRYMSPEQARGRRVGTPADIYSLGVMLYEMLTGNVPFVAEDSIAVIFMHVNEPIPKLPASVAQYQSVLDKMLAKEPAERYRTGREIIEAIVAASKVRQDKPQAAPHIVPGGPSARPVTKSPVPEPIEDDSEKTVLRPVVAASVAEKSSAIDPDDSEKTVLRPAVLASTLESSTTTTIAPDCDATVIRPVVTANVLPTQTDSQSHTATPVSSPAAVQVDGERKGRSKLLFLLIVLMTLVLIATGLWLFFPADDSAEKTIADDNDVTASVSQPNENTSSLPDSGPELDGSAIDSRGRSFDADDIPEERPQGITGNESGSEPESFDTSEDQLFGWEPLPAELDESTREQAETDAAAAEGELSAGDQTGSDARVELEDLADDEDGSTAPQAGDESADTESTPAEQVAEPERPRIPQSDIAMQIQQGLQRLGYDPGPADGRPGRRTKSAIRKYQRDFSLRVDGEAAELLLQHIQGVLNAPAAEPEPEPEPESEEDPSLLERLLQGDGDGSRAGPRGRR